MYQHTCWCRSKMQNLHTSITNEKKIVNRANGLADCVFSGVILLTYVLQQGAPWKESFENRESFCLLNKLPKAHLDG